MVTTHDEAMQFLTKEFLRKGIMSAADTQDEINKIVEAIPSATRDQYGSDAAVAAANFYSVYNGSLSGASVVPTANPTGLQASADIKVQRQKAEFTDPVLDSASSEALTDLLERTQEQRLRNTPLTRIERVLVENDKPSVVLAGLTVTPDTSAAKLAEYEGKLVQTTENIAAFNAIKEAVGKKNLPVYYNDKNRKVVGVKVVTPSTEPGKNEDEHVVLTNNRLVGFLVSRVMGRIPNDPVVGVKLTTVRPVTGGKSRTDATSYAGRPHIAWEGKSKALETDSMVEVINESVMVGAKPETMVARLRIDQTFKIISDKIDKTGQPLQRTVRLMGPCEAVPKFQRKRQFRTDFGDVHEAKTISAHLNDDEKAAAQKIAAKVIAGAVEGKLVGTLSGYGPEMVALAKQIKDAAKAGSVDAASNFSG